MPVKLMVCGVLPVKLGGTAGIASAPQDSVARFQKRKHVCAGVIPAGFLGLILMAQPVLAVLVNKIFKRYFALKHLVEALEILNVILAHIRTGIYGRFNFSGTHVAGRARKGLNILFAI